jgi:methyl-accepting chemotaxis protein
MVMHRTPDTAITAAAPAPVRRGLSLRRKLQIGFLLAALLTVLTGGGLTIHLTVMDPTISDGVFKPPPILDQEAHVRLLERVRYALLGGTLLVLTVLATIYLFLVRHVLHPLEHTAAAARQMVDGRLDTTVPIQDPDEIGRLGQMFNDLGINLQELILLVWNQTGSALNTLEGINQKLDNNNAASLATELHANLQAVRQNLGTMQTVAQSFDLYDVLLTGHKAVALEDLIDRAN